MELQRVCVYARVGTAKQANMISPEDKIKEMLPSGMPASRDFRLDAKMALDVKKK